MPLGGDYQLPGEVWWVSCLLGTCSTCHEPKPNVLQLFNHESHLWASLSALSHIVPGCTLPILIHPSLNGMSYFFFHLGRLI